MNLSNIKDYNTFVEKSISLFTSTIFIKLNEKMSYFNKNLTRCVYYIGPLLYGLNKYIYDKPSFGLFKNYILYRKIKCTKLHFCQYELNLGKIICFPSFTSTYYEPYDFTRPNGDNKLDNIDESMLNVKMIFKYEYIKGNISPGIIIDNNIDHGSRPLSKNNEKEVLLFPFTFAKINSINSEEKIGMKIKIIKFEIIPKKDYIEYKLREDVKN